MMYSYYTAGSGGAGPTILATSFLLAGEDAVVYREGKRYTYPPLSNRREVDFGPGAKCAGACGSVRCFKFDKPIQINAFIVAVTCLIGQFRTCSADFAVLSDGNDRFRASWTGLFRTVRPEIGALRLFRKVPINLISRSVWEIPRGESPTHITLSRVGIQLRLPLWGQCHSSGQASQRNSLRNAQSFSLQFYRPGWAVEIHENLSNARESLKSH